MIRLRSSRSAIIPDSGATKADGTWVNKKLADSHTVEPVLANATSASATLAAQLPVFDAADAAARTRTSPRVRLTIRCSPSEAAPQELPLNSAAIRVSTTCRSDQLQSRPRWPMAVIILCGRCATDLAR
jgi:hypothetical protein